MSDYLTVTAAAIRLSINPAALRKRLLRAAQKTRAGTRAVLGPGIEGIKIGSSWRVRIAE